jgi:hypothetical protein
MTALTKMLEKHKTTPLNLSLPLSYFIVTAIITIIIKISIDMCKLWGP